MAYRGRVKNGVVVFDPAVQLPEGANVEVEIVAPIVRDAEESDIPTLYEQLEPIIGIAEGLPSDLSANLDHYLYGLPKKD